MNQAGSLVLHLKLSAPALQSVHSSLHLAGRTSMPMTIIAIRAVPPACFGGGFPFAFNNSSALVHGRFRQGPQCRREVQFTLLRAVQH